MGAVLLEITYEGDHCMPCVYMRETIEEWINSLGGQVKLELVRLREMKGARRYQELSSSLGRPAPVPALFVNGKLCFDSTPTLSELKDLEKTIEQLLKVGD